MEFVKWSSIPRMSNETLIITEKIDGTSSCVVVMPSETWGDQEPVQQVIQVDNTGAGTLYGVFAQSRNRFVTPADDNMGFAGWVYDNASMLVDILGIGYHHGEWWGSKIQKGYGLTNGERRFSLFNAVRWKDLIGTRPGSTVVTNLCTVPLLYNGKFDGRQIQSCIESLRAKGTAVVDGDFAAEGMVVQLKEQQVRYKVLCKNDELHKWQVSNA